MKIMINSNIQQIDGYWTPLKMTMTTLAPGHQTVMEVLQVKYDRPINPDYFTTNFLQTGRTK